MRFIKNIGILFLIALFPLMVGLTSQATGYNDDFSSLLTRTAIGNFVEDFTTDVLRDPVTNAYGWGTGTVTNARNFSLSLLDFYDSKYPLTDIDVEGQRVYAASYNLTSTMPSIVVFDINDPADIWQTGSRNSLYAQMSIEADGDVLYVGSADGPLNVPCIANYYYTDPHSSGSYLGVTYSDGSVTDIELNGHLAYYTAYKSSSGSSLRVLYAENPDLPINVTANWMDSSNAQGLAVVGNTAFVAAAEDGFYVVNVSSTNFVTLGHVGIPGNATDVIVDGNYAYVTAGPEGVFSLDISDLTNPQVIGHYDTMGYARKMVLQGNTMFVADGGGVAILDVADPYHPTIVAGIGIGPYIYDVDLFGGVLIVSSHEGLHTFRIQAGVGVANIATKLCMNPYNDRQAMDVRVRGDLAYVAGGTDGIYILDVQDPNNPILVGDYSADPGQAFMSIDLDGDIAHIAGTGRHYRFDVSDPTDIKQINFVLATGCDDVYAEGDVSFVAYSGNVAIVNETDPYSFVLLDDLSVSTNISAVWVEGRYLYAVENQGGGVGNMMWIYDITDLTAPVLVGLESDNIQATDLYVDGDIAYVSEKYHSVVFNATDPTSPYWSAWSFPDSTGVWGFGPYMLNANPKGSVDIFDVHETTSLSILHSNYEVSTARRVTTKGDYLYVANQTSLAILRHFMSAGDTYYPGSTVAQSLVFHGGEGDITEATLNFDGYVPDGTAIEFFLSADGGVNWEPVTPGTPHAFASVGTELLWQAVILGPEDFSVHLYEVIIDFEYNAMPTTPTITALGDKGTGIFKVEWSASTDDGQVDHYILQMSDTNSFGTLLKEWTVKGTATSKTVMVGSGELYFRIQAVDNQDLAGDWSTPEMATVALSTMILGIIIGGALLLVIVVVVVVTVVVRKRKKVSTR